MIAALLLLTQVKAVPDITEFPNDKQDSIVIESVINLPKLNSAQRYVLSQSMNVAVQMTSEFGNRDIFNILKPGTRFHLYQAADHLRIGLTVDKENLTSGLSLLRSVLTQPTFLAETIKVRRSAWQDPWMPAYSGFESQETNLDRDTMARLWQSVMNPKMIFVAVSGNFAPGTPTEKWRSMQSLWPSVADSGLPLKFPPKVIDKPNSVPLILFDSKPLSITRENLASYFLAANALGVGKESILWLVAREEMNLSYRQESFLLPTESGWTFRMAFATDNDGAKPESIASLRQKIHARCEALTQSDLDHAVGLGRGYLQNRIPTFPLILGIGGEAPSDPNDQLYLRHYWNLRFGFGWTNQSLLEQMRGVKLEDLKRLLLQLIDQSNARVL